MQVYLDPSSSHEKVAEQREYSPSFSLRRFSVRLSSWEEEELELHLVWILVEEVQVCLSPSSSHEKVVEQ